jgi:hypothetical protein
MADHHPLPVDPHRAGGDGEEVGQQLLGEAAAGEVEMLELLRVRQPPHPIPHEHEVVLLHDRRPGGVLGRAEAVLDD